MRTRFLSSIFLRGGAAVHRLRHCTVKYFSSSRVDFPVDFYCRVIFMCVRAQASQAHVTSVLCEFSHKRVDVALHIATVETLYEKENTEVCER